MRGDRVSATAEAVDWALVLSPGAIPQAAAAVARAAILDALACALAGRGERVVRAVVDEISAEGSRGGASVWGTRLRATPARAALANGTAAHALDYDDVSFAMNGHPSAPLLPAVLAVAEARGASGAEALAAYVAGFEVQARLGQALSLSHYERGWHPTATLGAIGATVAAGRLLGLDPAARRRAIGIACSTAAGSLMNFCTDTKPLHAGLAAQAGVSAAALAARGVTAREDALECDMGLADLYAGARPLSLSPLGRPFALEDPGVELKPYPSCRFTHRLIDAVLALRARHPAERATRFECTIVPLAHKILIWPEPRNGLEAKFSAPYCTAVAWLDGRPDLAAFSDGRAARSDVQALLRHVSVADAAGAEESVRVEFASGASDEARVRHARGSPARPLSALERLEKVRDCAAPVLGLDGAEALADAVDGLERLADVRGLARLLAADEVAP